MRALWSALIVMAPICGSAQAAQATFAIYDRDPEHLWNRLYRAIAVRTEGGVAYGIDNADPYHDMFDDPARLIAILDEFLEKHGEDRAPGDLRRALLLNDVWAAFDLAASYVNAEAGGGLGAEGTSLRRRLARVIERLRLPSSHILGLLDNYAQAVKSAQFATDFDPQRADRAFLPPDLLDAKGQWVEIGENGRGAAAPFHLQMLSGRSVFRVFIRCPGGRQATLSYLKTLNLYRTPWKLDPDPVAIQTYPPTHEKVRTDPLRLDPATPQFPAGTMVALVRQMMVIDDELRPAPTSVTQTVQFRVFKDVGGPSYLVDRRDFNTHQLVYELVMRRRDLLTGQTGGLRPMGRNEVEYQRTQLAPSRAEELRGPVVLSTCAACHSANGIYSVNTYTRTLSQPALNPQLVPATSADYQATATADWKMSLFDWGLLRGVLEGEVPARLTH